MLSIAAPPAVGRRQLAILFTTGRDTISFLDRQTVLEIARRSFAAIFVVDGRFDLTPRDPLPEGATPRPVPIDRLTIPEPFLRELAETTGGTVQRVQSLTVHRNDSQLQHISATMGRAGIGDAFLSALDTFRASYVLRYVPEGVPRGGWHDLTVRVTRRGSFDVRARRGYVGGGRPD
jgi:hypothetical protein